MKIIRFLALPICACAFLIVPAARAQITRDIRANVPFPFYVQETRLPAGSYTLHMMEDSNLQVMEIRSEDDKTAVTFDVDNTQASSTPAKTQLIFHRYGNHEYLSRIVESGSMQGSRVVLTRSEKSLQKDGTKPEEHAIQAE
jgi:hypothetical protein